MERNLVIGASGGIGAAMCAALGGQVVSVSRQCDGLDVTDAASVARVLGGLEAGFDRILVAFGVLGTPEKSLSAINGDEMARVLAVNTIGVGLVLHHVPRLLAKSGRVGVLTARVGSIGDNRLGGWHSYRASKAAANQLIRGAAIELSRTHKGSVVAALHPGTVDTPFTAGYKAQQLSPEASATKLIAVLDGLSADQTGGFFDYSGAEVPW